MPRRVGKPLAVAALGCLAAGVAWDLCTFVGAKAPARSPSSQQMEGYRIDWMLERKDGTFDLQTQDGYWVGEVGYEKALGAQGLRYRMRATSQEIKEGREVDGYITQIGPLKLRLGEIFGGTGVNAELKKLKKQIFSEGVNDPKKIAENEYWLQRYGHKRWTPAYVDQTTATGGGSLLRGLAAWSGQDPLKEERGITWFEADYGKPWLQKYIGCRLDGFVTADQVTKEYADGKLLPPAPPAKK